MLIRNVKKKDLQDCAKLLHILEFKFSTGWYPDLEYVKIYFKSGLFFVAEEDSKVIGCIFGEKMRGHVGMMWYFTVHKKYRNKGIGRKMLSYFESQCKKQNIEWLVLYSPAKSKKALNFYKRKGYHKRKAYVEFVKQLK